MVVQKNNRQIKQMGLVKYYLTVIVALTFFLRINAQQMPITIINGYQEYNYDDSFDVVIINNNDSTYYITVGLEKYTDFDLWEEITSNILFKKSDIEGKSKGGLSYYLIPSGRIKINRIINEINIPFLIIPNETICEPMKKYRLSSNYETDHEKIILGRCRFSIKITNESEQKSYMVIKSKAFYISE